MLTRKANTVDNSAGFTGGTMASPTENFTVAILLCSYNGERFVTQQIESIQRQTHKNWTLYISDDGSTDRTIDRVCELQAAVPEGKIKLFEGPRQGFANNFISLLTRTEIQADFYAFCDQDDVWHDDKLQRSLDCLISTPSDATALYCSRTRLINDHGAFIGYSPLLTKPLGFSNALVQSIAGANTMVINHHTRTLLNIDYDSLPIVAHDWLIYMIVTGSEGFIHYDSTPTLDYRQHAHNLIGDQSGLRFKLVRFKKAFSGRFKTWCNQNISILTKLRSALSTKNQKKLDDFSSARSSHLVVRVSLMRRARIYRQTLTGNIGLFFAVLFNKI